MIVTIDGTSASGKSTTAIKVAKRLGFVYIDTGAMYRAVAFYCVEKNIKLNDKEKVGKISNEVDIKFIFKNEVNHIYLNGRDITELIRAEEVGRAASLIATYKTVRINLVKKQREMGNKGDVVCEGRDIGTVVFKNADVKIYMDADTKERARRRYTELGKEGDFNMIIQAVRERDEQDKTRQESPLKVPDGAVIIDTTNLSIKEEVERVIEVVKTRKKKIKESNR